MKLAVVGTGYVGLPVGTGFAELGHEVTCIDNNPEKIKGLRDGKPFLFEEGLEELFQKNIAERRLKFATSKQEGIKDARVIFLAVGTPQDPLTNRADLQYIQAAARELAPYLDRYTVIATKSTVPVGTNDEIDAIIRAENPLADYDVVSIPEFLREGFAVHDFFHPDRIVLGMQNPRPRAILDELYAHFQGKTQFFYTDRRSAEVIKYAANAFLAVKIGYANAMADLCQNVGGNISDVMQAMGADTRIGPKFLNPGIAYGGSCFPKDTNALFEIGQSHGVTLNVVKTTIERNEKRKKEMAELIIKTLSNIKNPRIALLGLAFKGGTDDCRQSPAMDVLGHLLEAVKRGVFNGKPTFIAYDPQAMENAKAILGNKIQYATTAMQALQGADATVILTEWNDFKSLDLNAVKGIMRAPYLLDLRNMLSRDNARELGFHYTGIGYPSFEMEQALREKYGRALAEHARYTLRSSTQDEIIGEYIDFSGFKKPIILDSADKAAELVWMYGTTVIEALNKTLGNLSNHDSSTQKRLLNQAEWIHKKMVEHPIQQKKEIEKLFSDKSTVMSAINANYKVDEIPDLVEHLKIIVCLQDIGHLSGINVSDGSKFNPTEITSRVKMDGNIHQEQLFNGQPHGIISAQILQEKGINNPEMILPVKYHDRKDAVSTLEQDADFQSLTQMQKKRILFVTDIIRSANKMACLQECSQTGIKRCMEMNDPNYVAGPISPKVLQQFYQKQTVDIKETVTYLDAMLKFASWGFDLPFKAAKNQFKNEIIIPLFKQIEAQAASEKQPDYLKTLKKIRNARTFIQQELDKPSMFFLPIQKPSRAEGRGI